MGTDNPGLQTPKENGTGLEMAVIQETTDERCAKSMQMPQAFILVCYDNTERDVIYLTVMN